MDNLARLKKPSELRDVGMQATYLSHVIANIEVHGDTVVPVPLALPSAFRLVLQPGKPFVLVLKISLDLSARLVMRLRQVHGKQQLVLPQRPAVCVLYRAFKRLDGTPHIANESPVCP